MRSIELGPIAKTAAALSMVAGVGMASSSGASELQPHHVSESGWTVLGGDPLIQGGVHSVGQVERLIDSSLGYKILQRENLSPQEISLIQADAKKGDVHKSTLHFGEKFSAMVFGPGGNEIDYNVTFADPRYRSGAPAFSEDVKMIKSSSSTEVVKNQAGQVIEKITTDDETITNLDIVVPQKCGNIALQKEVITHKTKVIIEIPPTTTTTTVPPTTTTTTVPPTTTTTVPPTTTTTVPPTTTTTVKGGDPGIGG